MKNEGTESWRDNLIVGSKDVPKPLLANAITALRDAPAWTNVLCFDAFATETILDQIPPWEFLGIAEWCSRVWTSQDDILTANWLQRQGIAVNVATAAQAVEVVARDRSFHPVLDYLDSLQHDGTPRLNSWLSTYLGCEQNAYIEAVGRSMLIAAVARIREPGCKVDTVPIFEGPQGARKSTAVKALFNPWFSDELADLGSKDAVMQTRGVWGIEVSELDAMSRMEVSRIKAFISRTTDRYRPPYGSRIVESPRSCVFWGTTNADDYLKDETGGRRFWPVKVGHIDIDGLLDMRGQLWAEAVVLYEAGVAWWLTKEDVQQEAERQQRDRYTGDPWEETIARYAATEDELTIEKVLRFGLQLDINRCAVPEKNRVARILKSLGWLRKQKRIGDRSGNERTHVYRKPVTAGDHRPETGVVTTLFPVTTSAVVTKEIPTPQGLSARSPWSPL